MRRRVIAILIGVLLSAANGTVLLYVFTPNSNIIENIDLAFLYNSFDCVGGTADSSVWPGIDISRHFNKKMTISATPSNLTSYQRKTSVLSALKSESSLAVEIELKLLKSLSCKQIKFAQYANEEYQWRAAIKQLSIRSGSLYETLPIETKQTGYGIKYPTTIVSIDPTPDSKKTSVPTENGMVKLQAGDLITLNYEIRPLFIDFDRAMLSIDFFNLNDGLDLEFRGLIPENRWEYAPTDSRRGNGFIVRDPYLSRIYSAILIICSTLFGVGVSLLFEALLSKS